LIDSNEDFREVAMFRYVLEVGAVELAVRNATEAQIARLQSLAAELERSLRERWGTERECELDIQFHVLIYEMTGSELIAAMQQMLRRFFAMVATPHTPPDTIERVVWEHRELAAAIADRDLERARTMIRSQLQHSLSQDSLARNDSNDGSASPAPAKINTLPC
jgi:DNA-binding FadR family transcriptional regulator